MNVDETSGGGNQNEQPYYPRQHPYKVQRQNANVRERKRMQRSVPRSEYEHFQFLSNISTKWLEFRTVYLNQNRVF